MTRTEVLKALQEGKKVTHKIFVASAWIKRKSARHYVDEKGNVISVRNFWQWRTGPKWNKDWSLYV